jgi:hypothetical protein
VMDNQTENNMFVIINIIIPNINIVYCTTLSYFKMLECFVSISAHST